MLGNWQLVRPEDGPVFARVKAVPVAIVLIPFVWFALGCLAVAMLALPLIVLIAPYNVKLLEVTRSKEKDDDATDEELIEKLKKRGWVLKDQEFIAGPEDGETHQQVLRRTKETS